MMRKGLFFKRHMRIRRTKKEKIEKKEEVKCKVGRQTTKRPHKFLAHNE